MPSVIGGYSRSISGLTSLQPRTVSTISGAPVANARSGFGITYGARDIDSEPPAIITWPQPAAGAWPSDTTACMPDPQRRLTVAPDTSTGRPASKTAIRPTLRLSSPAWLAAPHCTSSMADGSSDGLRSRRRRTTWAARSSGRTKASCPPIRPIGVRQPSTMKTSVMPRWRVVICCPPTPASASLRRRYLPPCFAWGTCPGPLPPPPLRSGGGVPFPLRCAQRDQATVRGMPEQLFFTESEDANRLLASDGPALMIGMLLDQQFPMERAFYGPYLLAERLGEDLDAARLASMDPDELETIFK